MNFLSILSYIKTLEDYHKFHPIICIGCHEIFEEYYDYYIHNNMLYILGISSTDIGSGGYKVISVVNPASITNVYCDDKLKADFTQASEVYPNSDVLNADFISLAKTFLANCKQNPNNFNLPYSNARILVGDESIRLSKSIEINGDLFSVDITELNIGKIVGNPGSPMCGTFRIFSEFDKIQVISAPFSEVFMSPFASIVSNEVLELSNNYRKNHFSVMGVPNYKHQEYAMGDRVWLDVTIKRKDGTIEPEVRKWFVSKVDRNSDIPMSKEAKEHDSWLEYDPETNEAIGG